MSTDTQYALWDDIWRPQAPLASLSKTGSYKRMTRAHALSMPYIEANPAALCSLIITDHDGGMADEITGLKGMPKPTFTTLNSHTKSGHIVYALSTPVILTDAAHRRPVNYLARIEAGLNTVLDGDIAYAGRITKNPYHQQHLALWDEYKGEKLRVYTLAELADPLRSLGALPRYDIKEPLTTSAVGRNCALFDITRKWSYRRRGNYQQLTEWEKIVLGKAWETNETYITENFTKGALTHQEVHHLSRSISRWTWRNITRTFQQEQTKRGKKGGQKSKRTTKITLNSVLLEDIG